MYIQKTEEILSDTTKFKLVKEDCFKGIIRLEDKLKRLLRLVKKKLSEKVYNFFFASGSTPGNLYGVPKIHKQGCPIRPILSSLDTFNYNVAKFFVPILPPLTTSNYTVTTYTQCDDEIFKLKLPNNSYRAGFDIKSLVPTFHLLNL